MNYSWLCLVRAGKPGCSASSPQISLCQTRCNKKHIIDVTFFLSFKEGKTLSTIHIPAKYSSQSIEL